MLTWEHTSFSVFPNPSYLQRDCKLVSEAEWWVVFSNVGFWGKNWISFSIVRNATKQLEADVRHLKVWKDARIANAVPVTLYWRVTVNVEMVVLNCHVCNQCLSGHNASMCCLFVGRVISPHHSGQMSQILRVVIWGCSLNVFVFVFLLVRSLRQLSQWSQVLGIALL